MTWLEIRLEYGITSSSIVINTIEGEYFANFIPKRIILIWIILISLVSRSFVFLEIVLEGITFSVLAELRVVNKRELTHLEYSNICCIRVVIWLCDRSRILLELFAISVMDSDLAWGFDFRWIVWLRVFVIVWIIYLLVSLLFTLSNHFFLLFLSNATLVDFTLR